MIEEEMVFALGFLTAGLLALACLPAVWRRALRLTSRRLGQLVPLSMDEIVAERDQLRAGFAVGQRQLEQKLEQVEAARSAALLDVGRRDARLATLEDEMSRERARIDTLTRELDSTTLELFGLRAETGATAIALFDSEGLAEQRRWELLEAEEKARGLQNTIDEGRAAIAAFETRILGLETTVTDLNQDLAKGRVEVVRAAEAAARTAGERDAARQAAESIAGKRDALQLQLDGLLAELAEMRTAALQKSGTAEAAEGRAADLARTVAVHQARIDELGAAKAAAEAEFAARMEAVRGEVRASAALVEELRAEKAALASALASARLVRNEGPSPAAHDDRHVAELRDAIKKVADDVLRMTEAGAVPAPAAADGGSGTRDSSALLPAK